MAVGKISELVDDSALAQLDALLQKLGISTQAMIDATAAAAKFNNEIGGVKTLTDFTQASQQAITALQGVKEAQTQVIVKQAELADATKTVVEAVKSKIITDENSQKLLQQVGGSLDANIKLLVQQKLELKNVNDQLKELSNQYAGSSKSQNILNAKTAELTKQSLELKNAIAAQSLVIKQQVKDNQAAEGSQDQMLSRLNQLRKAYNSLSQEERNNAQIGGVLLADIKQLSTETAKINEQQGKYNDSVGNYEQAIKNAISQYVPFGRQLVQGIDTLKAASAAEEGAATSLKTLGLGFAGFTITAFAVGISAATYYLSLFQDTANRVDIFMAGLKGRFADLGKSLVDMLPNEDEQKAKPTTFLGRLWDRTKEEALNDLTLGFKNATQDAADNAEAIQKLRIQYAALNDQLSLGIQKLDAHARLLRAEAKDKLAGSEERLRLDKQASDEEDKALDLATKKTNARIDLAIKEANQYNKLSAENEKTLRGGGQEAFTLAANLALKGSKGGISKQAYEDLKEGYAEQISLLQRLEMMKQRITNDSDNLKLKIAKQENHDELELLKARLEGEKITAKLILDDNKQSYEARLAALKIYTDRSRQLIAVQNQIANNAPQITNTKKQANNQTAKNENLGVDAFNLETSQKIQKEAIEEFKKIIHDLNTEVTDDLKESLNQQQIAVEKDAAYKIDVLTDQFTRGKIELEKYNHEIKLINDKANEEKLQAEIDTYKQILGVQVAFEAAQAVTGLPLSVASAQQIQGTKNKIATGETSLTRAKTQTKIDSAKGDKKDAKEKAAEFAQAIGYVQQLQDDASKIVQQNYENEIALLEKRKQVIQETADFEVKRIQNSILSSKEKAREESIIREQQKQQQIQVDAQIAKIKERQVKYDRASAILNIVENTSVGAAKALAQGGGLFGPGLAAVVIALGAAQLATVLATPLPKFEKGTKSSPEGFAHVGEAGTELMIDPSGRMSLTPSTDTITYLQKGTQIISNKELQRIAGKPELILISGNQQNDNRRLEKLMAENNELQKRQRRPIVNVQVDRWGDYSRRRNY